MAKEIKVAPNFKGSKIQAVLHGKLPDTPLETIDQYLKELKSHQEEWAQDYTISNRIKLLEETLKNIDKYKEEWVKGDLLARHIPKGHPEELESNLWPGQAGLYTRQVIEILQEIEKTGGSKPFAKARQDGGRVIVESFPRTIKDKLAFAGWRGEIHLESGTKLENLVSYQAKYYKDKTYQGGVSLLLMAGNVASLAISDLYQKLINEKRVVIIKVHPVLEYMGSILTKILEPFIKSGFVRIVMGGALEGSHLTSHPLVDDIHMTGSDKTFEAIVYGGGAVGAKNKAKDHRLNGKPVSAELGNITPVIVVPGDWEEKDYDYQADNIFFMLSAVNGYACIAARVLILPKFWPGSEKLLKKLQTRMEEAPQPVNYYPGTDPTVADAIACYPHMTKFGDLDKEHQPWMFVKDLDAHKDEVAFNREFWTSFLGQTYMDGTDTKDYLMNAVRFANEKLWGTLAATIIIDPKIEKELTNTGVLQKAIDQLHYGTVVINTYPGLAFSLGTCPWGGYPGATYDNIQSGNGFVLNPFMLDKVEKSVIYTPFQSSPRPIWFSKKPNVKAAKAITNFAISNSYGDLGRVILSVLRP
jgi:hypothetical protein